MKYLRGLNYNRFQKFQKLKLISLFLFPLSFVYGLIIWGKNFLYDYTILKPKKLPGLCLSIGNLTVGGSGKSPFLMFLLEHLRKKKKIVVLTRGYKSGLQGSDILLIQEKVIKFLQGEIRKVYPDEALMYSYNFPEIPILVSSKRYEAAQLYLKTHPVPDLWLLDDGFSHRKLHRDLDLVLQDWRHKDEKNLLPHGFLREPLSSLKRAHLSLMTHWKGKKNEETNPWKSHFTNSIPTDVFSGRPLSPSEKSLCLLCGISHPQNFIEEMKTYPIQEVICLGDHETFGENLKNRIKKHRGLITTEKDYYRDPEFFKDLSLPCYISKLSLQLEEPNAPSKLLKEISKRLKFD